MVTQPWQTPVQRRIVRNPKIMGGEPIIEGTRVSVSALVETYRLEPNLDRLGEAYPTLGPLELQDALAFYRANRSEIDRYIAEFDEDVAP